MLIGRETEFTYLRQTCEKPGSQLLIIYGQNYIGKSSLLLQFAAEHEYFYYLSRSCSENMQLKLWNDDLLQMENNVQGSDLISDDLEESFYTLLKKSTMQTNSKKIIIIDEFQLLVKSSDSFMNDLNRFLNEMKENTGYKDVLIILASSSIAWVENAMVQKMGRTALQISGLYKLKELSFSDVRKFLPEYSVKECLMIYGVTGGVPGILQEMDSSVSVEKNICHVFLRKNAFGRMFSNLILLEELRETSVYHTILETIASGKDKLNDIYAATKFSRAKISVYLKNLIQLEIVEKVFSYDTEGRENAKKGVYRIKNKFMLFWFTYLFPNMGKLETLSCDEFYENYIQPSFIKYLEISFKDMCVDYLYQLEEKGALPISIDKVGEWVGKTGNIDILMEGIDGDQVAAFCKCDTAMTTYEDFEWNLFNLENAKLKATYIYLFSMNGFDERMVMEGKRREDLVLISMNQMIFSEKLDKSTIE